MELYCHELESLNNKDITELDKLILYNNYNNVLNTIQSGETLYRNNKICNGLYNYKTKQHPKQCKPNVCYRNSLYYAIRNNCRSYSTIIKLLIDIIHHIPQLRQLCKCCKTNTLLDEKFLSINTSINQLLYSTWFLKCECIDKYKFNQYYADDFLNFKQINELFCMYMSSILFFFGNQLKLVEYIVAENNVSLVSYDFCLHEYMKKYITQCEHLNETSDEFNFDTIKHLIVDLKHTFEWYEENSKICILLLNQQSIETLNYYIKHNIKQLDVSLIDKLYEGIYIDIDYCLENTSCIDLCVSKGLYDVTNRLIEYNVTKLNMTVFLESIKNTNYNTCFSCLDILDTNKLNTYNGDLLYDVITSYMDEPLKCNYINELLDKNYISHQMNDIFNICIQCISDHDIIKRMITYVKPDIHHICTVIYKQNYDMFDLLVNNYDINYIDKYCDPLIFYCLKDIKCLQILLKHNHEIDILNNNGNTSLYEASVMGLNDSIQLLIDNGANYLITDQHKNTCLIQGMYNSNIIKPLIELKDKDNIYLANYENELGHNIFIAAVYSNKPVDIIRTISKYNHIDINHVDKCKMTMVNHLVTNKTISSKNKLMILDYILHRINFNNEKCHKPFLMQAMEQNEYYMACHTIKFLLKEDKILISHNNNQMTNLEKCFRLKNVNIKINMEYGLDIYTLVYNYLNQLYITDNNIFIDDYINGYNLYTVIIISLLMYIEYLLVK